LIVPRIPAEEAGDLDGAIATYEAIQRKNPRIRDAADEIRRLRMAKSP
jgi:Xaa-Pro aminopeptidase